MYYGTTSLTWSWTLPILQNGIFLCINKTQKPLHEYLEDYVSNSFYLKLSTRSHSQSCKLQQVIVKKQTHISGIYFSSFQFSKAVNTTSIKHVSKIYLTQEFVVYWYLNINHELCYVAYFVVFIRFVRSWDTLFYIYWINFEFYTLNTGIRSSYSMYSILQFGWEGRQYVQNYVFRYPLYFDFDSFLYCFN